MRTLRTLFLSLSLLATLSFANEIPLILEETIQLPEATPYWDVMPHEDGYYYWMTATPALSDSTLLKWGRSDTNETDSLILPTGSPNHVSGFYSEGGVPSAVVSVYRNFGFEAGNDRTLIYLLDLSSHSSILEPYQWSGSWGGYIYNYTIRSKYRISCAEGFPAPPQISTRIPAVINCSCYSYSHASEFGDVTQEYTTSTFVQNLLDSTSYEAGFSPAGLVSLAQWQDSLLIGTFGERSSYYQLYNGSSAAFSSVFNISVSTDDSLRWRASETISYTDLSLCQCIVVYDGFYRRPIIVMKIRSRDIEARTPADTSAIWEITDAYRQLMAAKVLIGDYSEQVLAYDEERQLFDIIKIEDGSIWGQTSELPNDYDDMKIIGRYDDRYRRLAVRCDNEISVYSFGADPNYVPPIAQSYTVFVYPNPFNSSANIDFELQLYERIRLAVFNTLGQEVAILADEQHSPGKYSYSFSANELPSGIYFAQLKTNTSHSTKKLVLLK